MHIGIGLYSNSKQDTVNSLNKEHKNTKELNNENLRSMLDHCLLTRSKFHLTIENRTNVVAQLRKFMPWGEMNGNGILIFPIKCSLFNMYTLACKISIDLPQ